jgi:hypothetical protein
MAFTDNERKVLRAFAEGGLPDGIAITTKVPKPEVARILKLVGTDRQRARVALNDEATGAHRRQLGVQATPAAPSGPAKPAASDLPESALVNAPKPGALGAQLQADLADAAAGLGGLSVDVVAAYRPTGKGRTEQRVEPSIRPGTIDALLAMAEEHDSAQVRGSAAVVRAALKELDEALAADDARAAAQRRVDELTEELERARKELLAFEAPHRRVPA